MATLTPEARFPTGAEQLVIRVATGAGFLPVEQNLTLTPEFSLYRNGQVIQTGLVIVIYPVPALPNLQTTVISGDAM